MAGEWKAGAKKEVAERAQGNTYKLKTGENVFRILANKKGEQYKPYIIFSQHVAGPNNRFVRCGKKNDGTGDCWLCDKKIPALKEDAKRVLREKAESLAPKEQLLFQVAWIEGNVWKGPKPLYVNLGKRQAFGNRLLAFIATGSRAYDSLVKGYNLIVEKTGEGMKTRYQEIQADEQPSKVPSGIVSRMQFFKDLIDPYDEEKMKNVYFGREDDKAVAEPEPEAEVSEPEETEAGEEVTEESGEEAEGSEPESEPEEESESELAPKPKAGKPKPKAPPVEEEESEPEAETESEGEAETEYAEEPTEEESEPEGETEYVEEPEAEEASEEESESELAPKPKAGKPKPKAPPVEEEEEEQAPKPKPKKPVPGKKPLAKPVAGKKSRPVDPDDE